MGTSLLTIENNLTFIHLNMDNNTNIFGVAKRCRYKIYQSFLSIIIYQMPYFDKLAPTHLPTPNCFFEVPRKAVNSFSK